MITIDISQYNGTINWNSLDVDNVFIRVGFRGYSAGTIKQDSKFLVNLKNASSKGFNVGLYFMSQAINLIEVREEVDYIIDIIKGYEINLPIFYDSEYSGEPNKNGRADKLTKLQRTAIAKTFCEDIQNAGYKAGVYASTSWFNSNLNVIELSNYFIWSAQYGDKCTATFKYDMWQYTSKGSVNGISGNLDLSYVYSDLINNKTETADTPNFTLGKYKLLANMKVRKGAGINFTPLTRNQLTVDGRIHATTSGSLLAETVVTVSQIVLESGNVWGKIPSGWIAIFYNSTKYAQKLC